jgi:hypothetical protein
MPPEWDFTEYSYKPFQNLLALHIVILSEAKDLVFSLG